MVLEHIIYLVPIDVQLHQPEQGVVRLDTRLLTGIECRTFLQIKNDDPCSVLEDGVRVFQSWMRKDLLTAFVQTLVTHRLCYSESRISFSELVNAFEYEGGLSLFHPLLNKNACSETNVLHYVPRMGIGYRKRKRSASESLRLIFQQVVNAISSWHRLQHALEYNIRKANGLASASSSTFLTCKPPSFDCSSSRFVIRLLNPPDKIAETTNDPTFELCNRKSCWLVKILSGFASLRNELVESKCHSKDDYSSHAFTLLQRKAESDSCGPFVSVLADTSRCCFKTVFYGSSSSQYQRAHNPLSFANEIIGAVLSYGNVVDASSTTMSTHVKFSRALVALALKTIKSMPRIGSLLTLSTPSSQASLERKLLEEELQKNKLHVVSWSDTTTLNIPLLFPPCLRNIINNNNQTRNNTPTLCLEVLET